MSQKVQVYKWHCCNVSFKCSSWPTQFGIKITNKIHLEREKIFLSDLTLPAHNNCVCLCACVSVNLHVDVWGLEAALVDVVVCEGLCGVGAVLVHSDGHFAMSHPSTVWTWDAVRSPRFSSEPCGGHPSELLSRSPGSLPAAAAATQPTDSTTTHCTLHRQETHTHTSCFNKACTFFWIHSRARASHKKIKKYRRLDLYILKWMQMQRLKIKHTCMQWRHVQSYSASENRKHLKFARKKKSSNSSSNTSS